MVSIDFIEEIIRLREGKESAQLRESLKNTLVKTAELGERNIRIFEPTSEQLRQAYSL